MSVNGMSPYGSNDYNPDIENSKVKKTEIGIAYWDRQAHLELIVKNQYFEFFCGNGSRVRSQNRNPSAIFYLNSKSLGITEQGIDKLYQDLIAEKVKSPLYKPSCSYSIVHILEKYSTYRFPPILVLSPTFLTSYLNNKRGALVESIYDRDSEDVQITFQNFKWELQRPMIGISKGFGITVGTCYAVVASLVGLVALVSMKKLSEIYG